MFSTLAYRNYIFFFTSTSHYRVGEPELEPAGVEQSISCGAGAGAFLNISLELEQQNFISSSYGLVMANLNNQ